MMSRQGILLYLGTMQKDEQQLSIFCALKMLTYSKSEEKVLLTLPFNILATVCFLTKENNYGYRKFNHSHYIL